MPPKKSAHTMQMDQLRNQVVKLEHEARNMATVFKKQKDVTTTTQIMLGMRECIKDLRKISHIVNKMESDHMEENPRFKQEIKRLHKRLEKSKCPELANTLLGQYAPESITSDDSTAERQLKLRTNRVAAATAVVAKGATGGAKRLRRKVARRRVTRKRRGRRARRSTRRRH